MLAAISLIEAGKFLPNRRWSVRKIWFNELEGIWKVVATV
jgi:hypothetical protein